MDGHTNVLTMRFDGTMQDRQEFLKRIQRVVINLVGSVSALDILIKEIAKNIFDHAHGLGSLVIEILDDSYEFEIRDDGEKQYDFEYCKKNSTAVGNGINCGFGLGVITTIPRDGEIDLRIDTSRGFRYSGTFTPIKRRSAI